jgi:hypothetical protein
MEPPREEKESQIVSLVAAIVVMIAIAIGPILVFAHRGDWTLADLVCPACVGVGGAFSLAVLVRAQSLRPGESILSGRFGLVIACVSLAVVGLLEGVIVVGLLTGELTGAPPHVRLGGPIALGAAFAYLARSIHANLTGRDRAREPDRGARQRGR